MLLIHLVKDSQCCGPNREILVFAEKGAGYAHDYPGFQLAGAYNVEPADGLGVSIALPFECEVKRLPCHKPVLNKQEERNAD